MQYFKNKVFALGTTAVLALMLVSSVLLSDKSFLTQQRTIGSKASETATTSDIGELVTGINKDLAKALKSHPDFPPSNIVDGNEGSFWNAGEPATPSNPQWIELDLDGSNLGANGISAITLKVVRSPAEGQIKYKIFAGSRTNPSFKVIDETRNVRMDEVIEHRFSPALLDISKIRVQMDESSASWAAWAEVKVYKKAVARTGKITTQGIKLWDSANNKEFKILSNQYVQIHTINTFPQINSFSADRYNSAQVEKDFADMKKYGYTSIRAVFNHGTDGKVGEKGWHCQDPQQNNFTQCVEVQSVKNLADLLYRANNHDIKVILTFVGNIVAPYMRRDAAYMGSMAGTYSNSTNQIYLSKVTVEDYGRYMNHFINYLKNVEGVPMSTILAIEPDAEPSLNVTQYPFNQFNTALVSTENCSTSSYISPFYTQVKINLPPCIAHIVDNTLKNQVNGQASTGMKYILNSSFPYALNHWRSRIKEVDSSVLVLFDLYPAYAVRDGSEARRVDDMILVNNNLQADVIAMQLYTAYGSAGTSMDTMMNFTPGFKNILTTRETNGVLNKPFFIMEYGIHEYEGSIANAANKLKDWLRQACVYKPAGWNHFTWNAIDTITYSAADDNYQIAAGLSEPNVRDLCAAPTTVPTSTPVPSTSPVGSSPTPVSTVNYPVYLAGAWSVSNTDTPMVVNGAQWSMRNSNTGGNPDSTIFYGLLNDIPVVCDWNGDKIKTVGIVRNENGKLRWFLKNTNQGGAAEIVFDFGEAGTTPFCGDWDGNGSDTPGYFKSSNATWYFRNSNSTGDSDSSLAYGIPGDTPVVGDWNGDQRASIGVFRLVGGNPNWFLNDTITTNAATAIFGYGIGGDKPVVGDWNGDGKDTIGIVRGDGNWFLRNTNSGGNADLAFQFTGKTVSGGVSPTITQIVVQPSPTTKPPTPTMTVKPPTPTPSGVCAANQTCEYSSICAGSGRTPVNKICAPFKYCCSGSTTFRR